jgi:hypothetical protein
MKSDRITFLLKEDESERFRANAKRRGHDTMSSYIRWLLRMDENDLNNTDPETGD